MRGRALAILSMLLVVLAACEGEESALDPFSHAAGTTATIWWILFWMGLAVYVVVMALAVVALRRARRRGPDQVSITARDEDERPSARRLVIYGGLIGPVIILFALNVITVPMGMSVNDRGPTAAVDDGVVIDVVAEKFWWRVDYPQFDVTTANEIHIPAGEPVQLRITSTDVVHSFWIPKLAGKIDATPGHTTSLTLDADEPGRYRGRCTEYCGLAHAQMVAFVVAQEREEFEAWAEQQAMPQPEPTDARLAEGREVFTSSSCVYCHTVDGHGPPSDIGPDLTHLASRETIGAGILPNSRGHLGGWIVDPQAQKPGNLMPGTQIAGEDLEILVDYLMSLE